MSDNVAERLISSFMATEQPSYAIGWQGGEPALMGVDFFRKIVSFQEKYGRNGAAVANGFQTNGTLLNDDWARLLSRYRFLCGVSLDGPESVHDSSRVNSAGEGSHADVLKGIECLRKFNVEFNILTLVNRANVTRPAEIYHYLVESGFYFHQYIECVEYDCDGNSTLSSITGEEWGSFLCGIFDEWMNGDQRRVSVRLFDSIILRMVDGVSNICSMAENCCQYLVVEHNGDVYPCDFFVEPGMLLGNIMNSSWSDLLNHPVYLDFGRRKASCSQSCRTCEFYRFCAGGCQKHRYGGEGRQGGRSRLCEGWKMFYRHALPGFEKLAADVRKERLLYSGLPAQKGAAANRKTAGRNDECPCGSARKYKKCCGS